MAFIEGITNAQFELGNMDAFALSSLMVASMFAYDNHTTMGSGACTFMSKLLRLCAQRTLQENAVRISTKSTVLCWFQEIWKNNVKIELLCH